MLKKYLKGLLLLLISTPTMAQLIKSDEVFSNKIEFSTNNFSAIVSGAKTNYSAVTTYHGSVYFVYCDNTRRPIVGMINPSGEVETAYLDKEETTPYLAQDDGHHVFSIGVDRMGYLHVTGDAHANLFGQDPDLLPLRFQGAPYMHWISELPQNIDDFEFVGLDANRVIPGYAFTYHSFHNDMNGTLYAQYRSRVHHVNLPPGSNGWCMSKYDEVTKTWQALGDVPEPTNTKAMYPAVIWEQGGHLNEEDPSVSFYQGFMSDVNFDFNNRMHIAATIAIDSTYESDSHVLYAYSDDEGESFYKAGGELITKLPIRAKQGVQQGSIVDSIGNKAFDGIYRNASVVFDMDGIPAVSFLTLEDRLIINSDDRDHYRYWISAQQTWSDLTLSPQESQAGSEHLLDCNGIITFAGSRVWNANMYRTKRYGEEGYAAYALPNESSAVNLSGADERAIREENVIRWMIQTDESLMIVSSKFEPASLDALTNNWQENKLGTATGEVGMYNDVMQIKSSGEGLLSDGSLDLQFINKTLEGNGSIQVRIINVDYNDGAFGGLMISEDASGSGNFYTALIDYEGLKAWSNTGNGGNIHYESTEKNEPAEWLKLVRTNNKIDAYSSDNGFDWDLFNSLEVNLPDIINIGIVSGSGGNWLGTSRADKLKLVEGTESVSVNEVASTKNMTIYPNPASSSINVEFIADHATINPLLIVDTKGNSIHNCPQKQTGINTVEIDISQLPSGIYYIGTIDGLWSKVVKR